MKPHIIFFTEGSHRFGWGHIMRCFALAEAFAKKEFEVSFVVDGDGEASTIIKDFSVLLGNWKTDTSLIRKVLYRNSIAIVDSYQATIETYQLIKSKAKTIAFLDDFNRLDYPDGLLINGTIGAEKLAYPAKRNKQMLVGSKFIILRPEFTFPQPMRIFPEKIQTILLMFGGTDPLHLTQKILPLITKRYPRAKKHVIVGTENYQKLSFHTGLDNYTLLHSHIEATLMRTLMLQSDLALSAAGQTINELAVCGLPSILFKTAENQRYNLEGWKEKGFIPSFIDATTSWETSELSQLLDQMDAASERKNRSKKGLTAIDTKGSTRIASRLLGAYYQTKIKLARATKKDLLPLFKLTNNPQVRANSFSTQLITLNEHTTWFYHILKMPDHPIYVFYYSNRLVGQIRFDIDHSQATISISIATPFRGFYLAPYLLKKAVLKLHKQHPEVTLIHAFVKGKNVASQNSFIAAGYTLYAIEENQVYHYQYFIL